MQTLGRCLPLALLISGAVGASAATYPPASAFLYGNTAVNAPAETNTVTGSGYPYRLLLPTNYSRANQYPVIVYLHGGGETGTDNRRQLTAGNGTANGGLALVSDENQAKFPCIFVAPQMPVNSWYNPGSVEAVSNLVVILKTQYSVDTNRICMTGLSSGGIGSWNLAARIVPNPFSCIVPLSGFSRHLDDTPKIPIWAFHAANDAVESIKFGNPVGMRVPGEHGSDVIVSHLRELGYPVIYTRYQLGNHNIWPRAYQHPLLLSWMFAQRLGQPPQGAPGLTITKSAQAGGKLMLTGTSTPAAGFTRVGWSSNFIKPSETFTNGVADGTATFNCATASFDSSWIGQRVAILPKRNDLGPAYYDIVAVSNPTTLTLSTNLAAGTYSFISYPRGTLQNPFPAEGSVSPNWRLENIPLQPGTNVIDVIAEAPSGVEAYGGLTTLNQQVTVKYDGGKTPAPASK